MFEFFAVISFIGIIGLIVSIICLANDTGPFGLWMPISAISFALVVIGGIGGTICQDIDEKNTATQEECIEDEYQYSYCPYCGKEIK